MNQPRLQQKYQQEVLPALQKEFKYSNVMAIPQIKKVVLNMGVKDPDDARARKQIIEKLLEQFEVISGQKPMITKAKKSIANFKLRAGDAMGMMVTLRGRMMWEFLDKLIAIALPRVKDFKGVSKVAFDGMGNYSLGIEEQIVFPEIVYDKIDRIRGFQINIGISGKNDQASFRLLELLGMPFEKENNG